MSLRNFRQIIEKVYDTVINSLRVSIIANNAAGKVAGAFDFVDYATHNISTSAYYTINAGLAADSNAQNIFHSSGSPMYLNIDGVDKIIVPPGGLENASLLIPAGKIIKIKAIGTAITKGQLCVNYYP